MPTHFAPVAASRQSAAYIFGNPQIGGALSRRRYGAVLAGILLAFSTVPIHAAPQPSAGELEAVLKSSASEKEKADACRELARIGGGGAVAPLAALLADEQLSHMARYALETIPGSGPDKAFRNSLSQLHGRLLVGVIGSIGVRRDPKAVRPLAKFLANPDADVVQAAARSLGNIGTADAAKALEAGLASASDASQLAFCEGLLRCAEHDLAQGQDAAALAIYEHLRAERAPHQVQTAALRGAILAQKEHGLRLLLDSVDSDDYSTFASAVRISQEIPGVRVTRLLSMEVPKLSADRQILLCEALGIRGDPEALPVVLSATRAGDKTVRLAAIRTVPEFQDASSVSTLAGLAGDSDAEISAAAQEALGALPGKQADAAVLAMVASKEPEKQLHGIDLIARRRMAFAVPQLFHAAEGADPKVCADALKRLGELAGPADLPRLLVLLSKTKNADILEAAEGAVSGVCLRAADPESCVHNLENELAQGQPPEKCALIRVLASIGGSHALSCVRAQLSSDSAEVRAAAVRAFAGWNNIEAAPDLLKLARTSADPTERTLCVRSIIGLAGQSDLPVEKRLALCRDAAALVDTPDDKKLLLGSLGGVPSVGSLELLQPYLDNAGLSDEAGIACANVIEKLLQGADAARVVPVVTPVLEKIILSTTNAELAKRAKTLLLQARAKAVSK